MKKIIITILIVFKISFLFAESIAIIEKRLVCLSNIEKISNEKKDSLLNDLQLLIKLNPDNKGNYELEKIKVFTSQNKYAEALKKALEIDNSLQKDLNYLTCKNYIFLNKFLYENLFLIADYKNARNYLLKTVNSDCYKPTMYSIINYKIAFTYLRDNESEKAINHLQNRINSLETKKDSASLIGAYNQLGLIKTLINKPSSAIKDFKIAIELIGKTNIRKDLKPNIEGNIGNSYKKLKNFELAKHYLKKDIKTNLENNEISSFLYASVEYYKIMMNVDRKHSLASLEKLLVDYDESSTYVKRLSYKELYENYGIIGNYKKSLKYFKLYYNITDSISKFNNNKQNELIKEYTKAYYNDIVFQLKTKNELSHNKLMLIEKQKKLDSQKSAFIYFMLLMFIIILFLVIAKINESKKNKAKMLEKQILIKEQENKLQKASQKLLELQIVSNKKDIHSLSLELNLKQELTEKIINKLSDLGIKKPNLRNLELFISNELNLKTERAKLQKYINSLGDSFLKTIKEKHPKLTSLDLQLCALIAMDLPNKEIAISKNISTDSVKVTKNRLKNKLLLDGEMNLTNYLQEVLATQ